MRGDKSSRQEAWDSSHLYWPVQLLWGPDRAALRWLEARRAQRRRLAHWQAVSTSNIFSNPFQVSSPYRRAGAAEAGEHPRGDEDRLLVAGGATPLSVRVPGEDLIRGALLAFMVVI